jgi:hypothetical protein
MHSNSCCSPLSADVLSIFPIFSAIVFLETALLIQAYVFEISYTFDFVPSLKASNLYSGSFS